MCNSFISKLSDSPNPLKAENLNVNGPHETDVSRVEDDNQPRLVINNIDLGEAQPEVQDEQPREQLSGGMARQLKRLLEQAAIHSYGSVSQDDVKTVLKAGKVKDKALASEVKRTQLELQQAMKKLDTIHGEQFNLILREGTEENRILMEAIEAQLDMAQVLEKLQDQPNVQGNVLRQVEAMRYKCLTRASELSRLAGELADKAEAALQAGKEINEINFPELYQVTTVMLPKMAGKMHGTEEALGHLKSHLEPLLNEIESYAGKPQDGMAAINLQVLQAKVSRMQKALAYAAQYGIDFSKDYSDEAALEDGGAIGPNGRVMVDPNILNAMSELLAKGMERLANLRQSIYVQTIEQAMDTAFKGNQALMKLLALPSGLSDILSHELSVFLKRYSDLLKQLNTFRQDPTERNKGKVRVAVNDFIECIQRNKIEENIQLLESIKRYRLHEWANFCNKEDFMALKEAMELFKLVNFKDVLDSNLLRSKVDHFLALPGNFRQIGDDSLTTNRLLQDIFLGKISLSVAVETRIHGYVDTQVNSLTRGTNLQRMQVLGSGVSNTVYLCHFEQGNDRGQFVFKPELQSRSGLGKMLVGRNNAYSDSQKVYDLNLATQICGEMLGVGRRIVRNSVGTLNGELGFFMEFAKGVEGEKLQKEGTLKKMLEPVHVSLCRQLNELQWLDLLTGQADRHANNYKVFIGDNGEVDVKGLDNDACMSARRVGVQLFEIPKKYVKEIEKFLKKLIGMDGLNLQGNEKDLEFNAYKTELMNALTLSDSSSGAEQMVTLDMSKITSPILRYALRNVLGVHTASLPSMISRDMYEKLIELKRSPDLRSEFANALAPHVSTAALANFNTRLDELIEHAEKLKSEDNVLESDQEWETALRQRIDSYEPKASYNALMAKYPNAPFVFLTKVARWSDRISAPDLIIRDFGSILKKWC